jgi:hypothetical protein
MAPRKAINLVTRGLRKALGGATSVVGVRGVLEIEEVRKSYDCDEERLRG